MWRLRRYFAKLNAFLQPERADRELTREMAAHLALMEEDLKQRGIPPEDAREAARRAYGGIEQVKELHREERSFVLLEQTIQDLRYACRSLLKDPGFTILAVLTLTLGIGVNATLFSAYNAVALKPLPVADPDRVVRMERWFQGGFRGEIQYAFSDAEYWYCRDHSTAFSSLVAASWPHAVMEQSDAGGRGERLTATLVSANYFRDLGIDVRPGRGFFAEEDRTPGAHPVMVISDRYWQSRFHGSPQAVGEIVKLNRTAFTVVGVAPKAFTGTSTTPQVPDFWIPLSMQAQVIPGGDAFQIQILGRLRQQVSLQRAQVEADVLIRQTASSHVSAETTTSVTLQRTALFGNTEDIRFKAAALALMLIVGMVQAVACANVANMVFARCAMRQREIGVRLALGAGRSRVMRQLLTESSLLASIGGLGGLLVSLWGARVLWASIVQNFLDTSGGAAFQANLEPDLTVLAYAAALSLLTAALFGMSPALQFSRSDLTTALKQEGTSLGLRVSRSRTRSVLLAAQAMVSMVLLIVTALLLRGLVRSQAAEPGFETRSVLLVMGDFASDTRKADDMQRRLAERLRNVPAIENVALGTFPMMGTWTPPILVDGDAGRTLASYASETYFSTLGLTLLRGRNFTAQDVSYGSKVAIISEATSRRYWPHADPLGKRLKLDPGFQGNPIEFVVVGVAHDVRFANLTRVDPAHVYLPSAPGDFQGVLVRSRGNPQAATTAVQAAVNTLDADLLPALSIVSVADGPLQAQKSLARTYTLYAAVLALLALTLAAVGIYGVMAYLVNQRVPEIGIRMALGANRAAVLREIVLNGLKPVFAGMFLGLCFSALISLALHETLFFPGSADLLYGVPFYDPATFFGVSCFLIVVAVMASAAPGRRALGVDPMVALRHE